MKKMILCLLAILPVFFMSCSKDDGEGGDIDFRSEIEKSYEKVQNGIVGRWKLYSHYDRRRNFWEQDNEYEIYKIWEIYTLTFNPDGTFTDKNGDTFKYSLELNTDYTHGGDYPFKDGYIKLKLHNFKSGFTEFYVTIEEDEMLYLYKFDFYYDFRLKKY